MLKNEIKEIIHTILPTKSRVALGAAFILSLIGTSLTLVSPLLIKEVVDQFSNQMIDWTIIVIVVGLLIVNSISGTASGAITQFTEEKIVFLLRELLWNKILKLPVSYFQKNKSDALITRLTNDTTLISSVLTEGLMSVLISFIAVIGTLVILFFVDVWLTVLVMLKPMAGKKMNGKEEKSFLLTCIN